MKSIKEMNKRLDEREQEIERLKGSLQTHEILLQSNTKEIERLNMRLEISNDTCNYLRNTIDKAIFFIQNQELHKSKDTTGRITMKERELIDILLGSDKE